ncbi:MAG: heme-copper oxidase subunit III, partial [Candidatus Eremiobacteraeota bacterium]|nr:heme-copper oxidase subunit III [Candidatus Eremiobacteraeota bacterium]
MAVSALNASHEAIHARYEDVDRPYREQRELRLLGFVLFLCSDVVLFSAFIFAYLYLRSSVPNWPPITKAGQLPRFDVAFAAINSVVLFGSGATMHFAMESWKRANRAGFNMWIIATIVLGIAFLGGQAYEYHSVTITWAGSTMGASFFTLTGMHGFHVFIGVIYLIVLYMQANRGVYTFSKYFGLTAGTLYWHFVDVIWVALFYL